MAKNKTQTWLRRLGSISGTFNERSNTLKMEPMTGQVAIKKSSQNSSENDKRSELSKILADADSMSHKDRHEFLEINLKGAKFTSLDFLIKFL